MWKFRIYMSVVIGSALTLLIFTTMAITWILGIMALMPGVALAGLVAPNASTPMPMLVANALFYSAAALPFVWLSTRRSEPKQQLRRAAVVTVITAAIVAGGWFGSRKYEQGGHGLCGNEAVTEVVSPDGRQKAATFLRNCGATTDYVTHVSVMRAPEQINHADVGNLLTINGDTTVHVEWTSPTSLRIDYPAAARVFLKESRYRDVSVTYEPK